MHDGALLLLARSRPLPGAPTRDQVCGVRLTFQGLTVRTQQYGILPWFDAALASLTPQDRQAVYTVKQAAGDTHQVVLFSHGGFLYDEPGQPYQSVPVPDHEHDLPSFVALIDEVIEAGFTPMVFLGGDDGERGYPVAVRQLPIVVQALGDRMRYVLVSPGFDGVFYGYTPEHVEAFGRLFRALCPDGYLAIEHSTGHIPVGNGPQDYSSGGPMQSYDVILSEFDRFPATDAVWQVAARLLGPAYRRPPDQPAADDPRPPFYLQGGTPRGPYFTCAFEWVGLYDWVRHRTTAEQIAHERAYFEALGYVYTG